MTSRPWGSKIFDDTKNWVTSFMDDHYKKSTVITKLPVMNIYYTETKGNKSLPFYQIDFIKNDKFTYHIVFHLVVKRVFLTFIYHD